MKYTSSPHSLHTMMAPHMHFSPVKTLWPRSISFCLPKNVQVYTALASIPSPISFISCLSQSILTHIWVSLWPKPKSVPLLSCPSSLHTEIPGGISTTLSFKTIQSETLQLFKTEHEFMHKICQGIMGKIICINTWWHSILSCAHN